MAGTVTDASGGVVPQATVTATNTDTGIRQTVATDHKGFYSFASLPIGRYDLEIATHAGFEPYRRTGIVLDANGALTIDAILEVGERSDVVTVIENQLHVETSSTQMGEVITGAQITAVPLNGRSFTDLLALQPGVAPVTSITSDTVQDVGASALSPSGDLNPGTISINGQREFANSFLVNGSDVEEDVNMGAAIVPNLDSIAEFRILTNNFDAEYGEFSGGQINVVTKSGTNALHGDIFEFVHAADLDARNYFSPTRGAFDQNQFGGTFGGPIQKNKIFFFGDYQGTRSTQGVKTRPQIPVPSHRTGPGHLSDLASSFRHHRRRWKHHPDNGQAGRIGLACFRKSWATRFRRANPTTRPDAPVRSSVFFEDATIPPSAWSAPATNLLQYIPTPSNANGTFTQPPPTTRHCETTRVLTGSMPTRAGGCSPPTTSSTTGRRTIPTRSRKAGQTCQASTRSVRAASQLIDLGIPKR